ncbi:MAG: hypothetical protein ACKPB3_04785 [Bacteroidota bacterium]
MNKTATNYPTSTETATKGAYMVYDHAEDEMQTNSIRTSNSAAAIELATVICLAAIMVAMTLM